MKILIIGMNAREEILIEHLINSKKVESIFCAPGNPSIAKNATCVNINIDDITSFVHFAKENKIDLTITLNEYVIAKGIANVFKENKLNIFAPVLSSALISMNKITLKRFADKYSIPAAYSEIFDKEQAALNYLQKSKYPILVRVPDLVEEDSFYCETFLQARKQILKLFNENNKYIILENFMQGETITLPVITDGYNVLALPYVKTYKRMLDGDGGEYTKPVGALAPFGKIDKNLEQEIAQNIIFRYLDGLQANNIHYEGFLSFDLIINQKGVFLTDVIPTIDNTIAAAVFPLITDDIADIIFATINGALGDVYPSIKTNSLNTIAVPLLCSKFAKDFNSQFVIDGIENIDDDSVNIYYNETSMNENFDILAKGFRPLILNSTASTLTKARNNIYSSIENIKFTNLSFRSDIGKINQNIFY